MEHNPHRLYRGPVGVVAEPFVRLLRGRGFGRFWPVWKAHRAMWRLTRSNRVLIAGHDMLLDPWDALGLSRGSYEPDELAWYESVVKPGDTVVEVGANIGFFTLVLARLVGPTGRVVSYEPDPDLRAILQRNVEVNGYAYVEIREAAVADRAGEMTFYRSRRNTGDHRLHPHGEDDVSFPVPVVRLDDDLAEIRSRVNLLKMDIQGAEPLAFAGLGQIKEHAPPRRMLVEFWPYGINGMGQDPRAFLKEIIGAGYHVSAIDSGQSIDVDDILRRLTVTNEEWVNLVCVHDSELGP